MNIIIKDAIRRVAPSLKIITIEAEVENSPTPEELWLEIESECKNVSAKYEMLQINKRQAISATRNAYKSLGKDPNRYRPSAEALCRRAVKNMSLYRINTLVDLINLVSLKSGYSIGGFDKDKIEGNRLSLGVGEENELFEGIGRGPLNIHLLPVYRDALRGIGTPTSDEERTKLSVSTTKLLMCINVYGEEMPIDDVIEYSVGLLKKYAKAQNVEVNIIA